MKYSVSLTQTETRLYSLSQQAIGIWDEANTLQAAAVWGDAGAEAALAQYLYRQLSIFNEPDKLIRNGRLRLTQATARVISNGLNLLCIEAPERM